jgi:predicted small secreted protein
MEEEMKKTVSILLAVLMLSVALTGCGSNQNSPEGVAQKFVNAISNGDFNALIECMTPEYQEAMKTLMQMYGDQFSVEDLFAMVGVDGGMKISMKVNDVQIKGDRAVVNATLTSAGMSDDAEIPCVRVDGKWYVDFDN